MALASEAAAGGGSLAVLTDGHTNTAASSAATYATERDSPRSLLKGISTISGFGDSEQEDDERQAGSMYHDFCYEAADKCDHKGKEKSEEKDAKREEKGDEKCAEKYDYEDAKVNRDI